jgi:hypothetical protein
MVVLTCNSSTGEAEAGSHELETRLGYVLHDPSCEMFQKRRWRWQEDQGLHGAWGPREERVELRGFGGDETVVWDTEKTDTPCYTFYKTHGMDWGKPGLLVVRMGCGGVRGHDRHTP